MIWNVSPEIFRLGPVALRWYSLGFVISFLLGWRIMRRIFLSEGRNPALLDPLLIYVMIGTVIGARLGHTLIYDPGFYLQHPLEILKIWEGGLASHGGAIGVLLALYLFTKKHPEILFSWLLDRIVIPVALAGGFIRLGNLMNSEIIGKPTTLPWAFVFSRVDFIPRHPTQLYEALSYFGIFLLLFFLYRSTFKNALRGFSSQIRRPGFLSGLFFVLVFLARFLIEFAKERQVAFENALPLDLGQLLSIPFIFVGLWLVFSSKKKRFPESLNPVNNQ